jgi:crotonobetainyl-CoA:carnitine CoA-transferase CaiB-like acyl-CoA transferase
MMRPLDNVRILDLSRFLAGPLCGMLLADMGAEVIRIEQPGGGEDRKWALMGPDGENLPFKIFARNKKSITLQFRKERGREIFREMVIRSDVVLHNFPPGAPIAEELTYHRLKEINSRIIVATITGYGLNGPMAQQVGLDFAIQAASGSMVLNGFPGGTPLKTTVPYIDCGAGTNCALGILLALFHRERVGVGQAIDISLFDTGFFITQALGALLLYKVYNERRERLSNFGFSTYMSCLRAKDGYVMVVPSTDSMWTRFTKVIEREDMISDPKFKSDMDRWRNTAHIEPVVQEWASQRTVDEIVGVMRDARVACAPVNSSDQLLNDPQVVAREMIAWVDFPGLGRIPLPGTPIKLSLTPGGITVRAPCIGEHNEEIYHGLLGIEVEELEDLREKGVI